jgi:predicted short-subunit dehydrogenase-like oxidoreductase (DUF2520 family)
VDSAYASVTTGTPSGLERGVADKKIPESPLRIALIGTGRVGPAVAALLQEAGHVVTGVASRTRDSAAATASRFNAPIFEAHAELPDATVFLIAVPDAAIREVVHGIGTRLPAGAVVCHFAGAFGVEFLGPVADSSGRCALHPVQACPTTALAMARLPGSAWGVTCSPWLQTWARDLVGRDLRGLPIDVVEEDRPLWHAAAVTTANGATALISSAEAMLRSIGIERPMDVLGPLAAGAVQNARDVQDAVSVLTGPAIRGDVATIRLHLDALSRRVPELSHAYRLAARITIDAARRSGRLDAVGTDLGGVLEAP